MCSMPEKTAGATNSTPVLIALPKLCNLNFVLYLFPITSAETEDMPVRAKNPLVHGHLRKSQL